MKFEEILTDLNNNVFKPVYFLQGEEEYFIDIITDYIAENALSETDREFNQTILYGKDVSIGDILDAAKRYPMMASHQVVIVKEAQVIKEIEDLTNYFKNPVQTTILVICHKHKSFDARKALAKAALKNGVFFSSPRVYDNKIPAWINEQLRYDGFTITPEAGRLLIASTGNELTKIRMELDKLILNIKRGSEINEDLIEEYIGISKEFNIFELQKAMGNGDIYKANLICRHFAANPKTNPLILTLMLLYQFFTKLLIYHQLKDKRSSNTIATELSINPFFVRDYQRAAKTFTLPRTIRAIHLLREYDLRNKGINNNSTNEGELLREMVFKMMH